MINNLPAMWETWVRSLDWEYPLEQSMATHSIVIAWRNSMDRGAWRATVRRVAKSQTRLSDSAHRSFHSHLEALFSSLSIPRWQPTPVLSPGKSHGRRSLVDYSPWGSEESDTTERLHFHFSLSCIGEGNGNPLQYSCLENPKDGGAWCAAIYGVAQSRTRLM